jgi:uncharacterized protein with HEPN domain
MKKDPRVYVAQILERIDRIREYTAEGKEAFFTGERTQDAVIRNFEIIGEVPKRIPDEYRKNHPSIPWREAAGFRDVDFRAPKDIPWESPTASVKLPMAANHLDRGALSLLSSH